jgi:2'-5' RNA ligase
VISASYQTALVLIPPEDVWEPIQRIRRLYDQKVRRWMPHITLLYPFAPPGEFGALAAQIAGVCAVVPIFDITLARFNVFAHRRQSVLWLAPEPPQPLVALQNALASALPRELAPSRPFTPHLSVGQVNGRAARDELLAELGAAWQPLTFAAERVSLIARGTPPDDIFQVEYVFGLMPRRASGAAEAPAGRV